MPTLAPPLRIWTRSVSSSLQQCLRVASETPSLELARIQHAGYVAALRGLGIEVDELPALDTAPDAVFVEDTAVIIGAHALITRPGAPERRGEVASIAAALAPHLQVHTMEAPACLDGGDVLRVGDHLYVGMSARTNADGVEQLAKFAVRQGLTTRTIPVEAGLHLKSAVTALDESTVIVDPNQLDPALLKALGLRVIEAQEPAGANVLALGRWCITSAAAPKTATLLATLGHHVLPVEVDQFHIADGALTCLSLRVAAPGTWCV